MACQKWQRIPDEWMCEICGSIAVDVRSHVGSTRPSQGGEWIITEGSDRDVDICYDSDDVKFIKEEKARIELKEGQPLPGQSENASKCPSECREKGQKRKHICSTRGQQINSASSGGNDSNSTEERWFFSTDGVKRLRNEGGNMRALLRDSCLNTAVEYSVMTAAQDLHQVTLNPSPQSDPNCRINTNRMVDSEPIVIKDSDSESSFEASVMELNGLKEMDSMQEANSQGENEGNDYCLITKVVSKPTRPRMVLKEW